MRRRLQIAVTAVLVSLTACGGGGAGAERDAAEPGEVGDTTTVPSGDVPGGSSENGGTSGSSGDVSASGNPPSRPSEGGDGGATATSAPAGQQTEGRQQPLPFEASLGSSCVKAGSSQSIRVKTLPQSAVTYDSYYPDGNSGVSENFYGGNNGNQVGPDGVYEDTWVINPAAPPGTVKVLTRGVRLGHEPAGKDLVFELVGPGGTCP